jgi:transposase
MSKSVHTTTHSKPQPKYTILKQSVGFDVSKDKFNVCFSQGQSDRAFRIVSSHSFSCDTKGFEALQEWLLKHRAAANSDVPFHMLMEATGVYYENLAYFLRSKGYRVTVILANKAKSFAKSLDYKSKTDVIDAKILAQMSLERDLPEWTPPSSNMLTIKRLCRERAELVAEKTVISNRLHAQNYAYAPASKTIERLKSLIKTIEDLIAQVDKDIKAACEKDPDIKQRLDNVQTIKGVGLITAATIVGETNGFTLFENKAQLVSYAGYDVVKNESGDSVHKQTKISKKGNSHIRRALHCPALVVVKSNDVFENLKTRVLDTTKIKMKGYVAVQRKLLVLIYTLYKKNVPFEPDYHKMENIKSRQEQAPACAA